MNKTVDLDKLLLTVQGLVEQTEKDRKRAEEDRIRSEQELMKLDKKLKESDKHIGGLKHSLGEYAEEVIYRATKKQLKHRGIDAKSVDTNIKAPGLAEYDIVAVNGSEVVVTEVKHKLSVAEIDEFVTKKLPLFTKAFPQYKKYKLYGAVGGLIVKKDIERYAIKQGLFVFTQKNNHAEIVNPEGFKPKLYS